MSRGISREMINVNSLETINAAANAITSADFRVSPPVVQKRRWSISWGGYWCFGSQKNKQRFGHAVLVPEPTPTPSRNESGALSIIQNAAQSQSMRTLFVAPPSSPASFLPSESDPPSASQSPVGLMYSPPGGPHSMFAIGPYAHETQLVTPPVFSTYTTEPSTAPFTPPPESPEVPFAQLLHPLHPTSDLASTSPSPSLQYDFLSYLLHPGSPVGPLISPNSALSASATSSPVPAYPHFTGDQALQESDGRDYCRNKRVGDNAADGSERGLVTANDGHLHQKGGISLGSMSEFNFDHINGTMNSSEKASISWSWWANEKVVGKGGEVSKNWSFFHIMQHQPGGVS